MARTTKEWVGKTDDSMPPPSVRLRIFEIHGGRCHFSGRKILSGEAWELDHVVALINGGENRESNLAPILKDKHKAKTAADVAIKSKTYRVKAKALGLRKAKNPIPGSKASGFRKRMNGTVERRQ